MDVPLCHSGSRHNYSLYCALTALRRSSAEIPTNSVPCAALLVATRLSVLTISVWGIIVFARFSVKGGDLSNSCGILYGTAATDSALGSAGKATWTSL